MSLDRRLLARVDRRLLSELDHADSVQLVKVPVSDAVWSTWRRYCSTAQVSMGQGLAMLLHGELASVVDQDLETVSAALDAREAALVRREGQMDERESEVRRRETELAMRERKIASEPPTSIVPPEKIGRNEPCWCGSDRKFKYCHGRKS